MKLIRPLAKAALAQGETQACHMAYAWAQQYSDKQNTYYVFPDISGHIWPVKLPFQQLFGFLDTLVACKLIIMIQV